MKKTIFFLVCALLLIVVSCNKNDPEPTPTAGGLSCTMAIYGSCGANNDNEIEIDYVNELIEAMWVGPTEKVHVIAQHNYDSKEPGLTYLNGTAVMRLLMKNEDIEEISRKNLDYSSCKTVIDSNLVRSKAINAKLKEMVESGAYSFEKLNGDTRAKLYLPSEIAKFLDRAAKECPADHYQLCISGHGAGWDAKSDRENAKAVAFDNNLPDTTGISAKNLVAGINASSIANKIPVLYMNACQMNFLENICEYASCPVTYAMLSFKNTDGTDNEIVMKALTTTQGNEVSDLLNTLIAAYEKVYKEKKCEISFVDVKAMKSAVTAVKDLVPLLKEDYLDDKKWYNGEIYDLQCPNGKIGGCDKDFSQFLDELANEENIKTSIKTASASILANIRASIVKTIYGGNCSVKKNLLTGAKFIGKTEYAKSYKDYAASYNDNAFYQLTGWNTLFEVFDDDIND